jgi:hypothetical protein
VAAAAFTLGSIVPSVLPTKSGRCETSAGNSCGDTERKEGDHGRPLSCDGRTYLAKVR